MSTQIEEIQITGSLLTFSLFEEKLMRNFIFINNKLKRLGELNELDGRIRGLQKQLKFTNVKLDNIIEKIPKQGGITRSDVKMLIKDQILEMFNNNDEKIKSSKLIQSLKKQMESIAQDTSTGKKRFGLGVNLSQVSGNQQTNQKGQGNLNKLSLTAGQILMNDGQSKRMPNLQDVLDKNQYNMVQNIYAGEQQNNINNHLFQINNKIEDLYRKLQEMRLGKGLNDYTERQLQKFEKYQQYQQKSQQQKRKNSQIKLQGIKRQNIKGEILKNDLYSQMQKVELVKNQLAKQSANRKNLLSKGNTTASNFRDEVMRKTDTIKIIQQSEIEAKFKRAKSTKRLQRLQRRLKVDDLKELNSVLKEIELRIQGKVSHEIFMGFIHDFEQKLEILRITKDSTNQINDLKKIVNSLDSRVHSIITFLQSSTNQDDALFVKKQWTCVSCDKNIEKFNGKINNHLNWDALNSKKLSPNKAGAFGQTSQLATKIKNLMDNQRSGQ